MSERAAQATAALRASAREAQERLAPPLSDAEAGAERAGRAKAAFGKGIPPLLHETERKTQEAEQETTRTTAEAKGILAQVGRLRFARRLHAMGLANWLLRLAIMLLALLSLAWTIAKPIIAVFLGLLMLRALFLGG